MVVDNDVWKDFLALVAKFDATHASGLPLPRNFQESRYFVSVLQDFLADFPACFGYGLAPSHRQTEDVTCKQHAPKSHNAGYCRKTITRKIVIWAQSCSPQCAWQGWTAGMLAQMCPDANGYLGHLSPHTSSQELLHMFSGVNPWMVSCWACLFACVPYHAQTDAFQQADTRLWKLSRQLKARHGGVEPNMKSLAQEFVRMKL